MFAFRGFAVVALGVGVLVLSGCAPVHHGAGASHRPSTSAHASATPTASASPTKPTLAQLVVSPNGLGDLVPGQPVPEDAAATAIVTFDPTKCVEDGDGISAGSPGAGAWIATYPDAAGFDGTARSPFNVLPVQNRTDSILGIQVWSPELRTAQHIGVGSSLVQLMAAYGTSLTVDTADNSDVYDLRGTRGQLLFEVLKGPDNVGEPEGVVAWMQIIPTTEAPYHIANSDGAGPCSA